MKKRKQAGLLVGIVLTLVIFGCAIDDAADRQPPIDTDTDQYLNPPGAAEHKEEDDIDRTNREWLEESRKSRLNRHR